MNSDKVSQIPSIFRVLNFFRSLACSEDMEKVVPSITEDVKSVLARFWCPSSKKIVQCNSHSDKVFLVTTTNETIHYEGRPFQNQKLEVFFK